MPTKILSEGMEERRHEYAGKFKQRWDLSTKPP